MNEILRPITEDGNVGFDKYDQLVCWVQRGESKVGTLIKDVRTLTCYICNHGWEATAEGMRDQRHWQLTDSWVHETCLIRHAALAERAEFRNAMFDARTNLVGVRFEVEDIPNRYWGDKDPYGAKPWYRFKLLYFPVTFILGNRKRIAVVLVEPTEGELAWWKAAQDHFASESVTKDFGPKTVMLHAWHKDKLKEYVKKLAWFAEGSPRQEDPCVTATACSRCGHPKLGKVTENHQIEVAGHTFNVRVDAYACEECSAHYIPLPELEHADLLVAAWLAEHGVRKREAFRFMRKALGMRAVDLSELLDVTPETVSRWERGGLPVEPRACALLGTLVCEREEGVEKTLPRLRALREPPEVPAGPVRLPQENAE